MEVIKASVSERIGITDVTIHYDRPAVKGYGRENLGRASFTKDFTDLDLNKQSCAIEGWS